MDEYGVNVITVIDDTVTAETKNADLLDLLNTWKPTKTVVLLVSPVNKAAAVGSSNDISASLPDISGEHTRIEGQLTNEIPIDMVLLDYYSGITLSGVTVSEEKAEEEYEVTDVKKPKTLDEVKATRKKGLSILDILILGAVVLAVIGGIVFMLLVNKKKNRIAHDAKVFREYVKSNPEYSRRDIWEYLTEEGEIKSTYAEYKKYRMQTTVQRDRNQNKGQIL